MTEIFITGNYSNSGTITGDIGDGLHTDGPVNGNIINSGSITASGGDTIHIQGVLTGSITNTATGVITNTSSAHNAVNIGGDASGAGGITGGIINSGMINGVGTVINIAAGTANIMNNANGIISDTAPGAVIILKNTSTTGSTINNSGTITTSGAGGFAFITYQPASATDTIINSGTISLTGGGGGAAFSINGLSPATLAQYGVAQISGAATVAITNSGVISTDDSGADAGGIEIFGGTVTINNQSSGIISNSGSGANAIAFIGSAASGNITNAGTISQTNGPAIDDSQSGTSHIITNSGTITGNILLSPQSDIVNLNGGNINGDILATAAGHGTVNIAVGAGNSFLATGKIGDPSGLALAQVNLQSGNLSINADNINAASLTFNTATTATLTLTGSLASFHDPIGGWSASSGTIDLANIVATAASVNASDQLVVTNNGATVATLQLNGSFIGATLSLSSDGSGGTDLTARYTAISAISNSQAITIPVQITDSAKNLSSNIDGLQALAAAGKLADIVLTDSGIPTLTISAPQLTSDAAALNFLTGFYSLAETAPATAVNITGSSASLGNTVIFSGNAASYAINPLGNGLGFQVAGNGVTDTLSNIQAVQFADHTLIVAAAPGNGVVTTGNITELYGAVFGREPDVPGLAYYQQELAANPSISLISLAQNFLAAPEYTNNTAHNYAPTTAGDTQFIGDLYNNLLHRAPAAGDAAWYEANVIAPITAGTAPGTSAYTAALGLAHAAVVTDFSASSEFLGNVQVTATNPASAQHWLVLI